MWYHKSSTRNEGEYNEVGVYTRDLAFSLGAEGELQLSASIVDPVLGFHGVRVNMREPSDTIVGILEIGTFRVEHVKVSLGASDGQ
jgi:hypothetical protein